VAVRVCQALQEAAGPGDQWDIEIAPLEQWIDDFGLAIGLTTPRAASGRSARGREAIEAGRALRRAIIARVAAPGAEDGESKE
jgi:hypothetical protein